MLEDRILAGSSVLFRYRKLLLDASNLAVGKVRHPSATLTPKAK
jgi:hypothetical protein